EPACREMLHQREEKRQILGRHPLLIECEDVVAARGVDQEVRVLHALRDALVRQELAEIVLAQEIGQILRRDIGVNGHSGALCRQSAVPRPKWAAPRRGVKRAELMDRLARDAYIPAIPVIHDDKQASPGGRSERRGDLPWRPRRCCRRRPPSGSARKPLYRSSRSPISASCTCSK